MRFQRNKISKIVALAINFRGATGLTATITEPLVFLKSSNAITGNNAKIKLPFSEKTWGESELAAVIKKPSKNVPLNEAQDCILGYLPANDVSCDNIESWDHHLARSKSADGFCPLGDYIDTDYDPRNKIIRAYHNDVLLREGNTNSMIWPFPKIIHWLSQWMTLYPGDIVLSGAPPRVGEKLFLKPGDSFRVEIEGLKPLITYFV